LSSPAEGTFYLQAIGSRPRLVVPADGTGVVGHAGARLLADLADATGLSSACSNVLGRLRPRGTGHDPGRIATDLAVMIADGGETITDLAVLRDQGEAFGPVASTPTAWRLLAGMNGAGLAPLRSARAQAPGSGLAAGRRNRRGHTRGDGCKTRGARADPGHRRHTDHLLLGEGRRRPDLQRRLRLPPAAVFPGKHRRGHVRAAALAVWTGACPTCHRNTPEPIPTRLTFAGTIIETGTDSFRLAQTRARARAEQSSD
jgi:hypothetical protein